MRRFALLALAFIASCSSAGQDKEPSPVGTREQALDTAFAAGSLIVPMDTAYQDTGTLTAFGLVYDLLKKGVPVRWVVKTGKAQGGADFTASAKDVTTMATITAHNYRGGPFVIDSADAAKATPIITAWIAGHPTTHVHNATTAFTGDVRRTMTAAPKIGVFVDGNEDIAFRYLNSAGIPDSTGKAWPTARDATGTYAAYPDILQDKRIKGATTAAGDGALMNADGTPKYCQLTSMHYAGPADEDVVKEVRFWLSSSPSTHAFMECEAVATFENAVNGKFLTTNGIIDGGGTPAPLTNRHPDSTFAQYDGSFTAVNGSFNNLSLAATSAYRASDVVLVNRTTSALTRDTVWLTGYVDGDTKKGKVSYLTGHEYSQATPISTHPATNGVRLFLDSLFESGCTATEGQPTLTFTKSAPATTSASTVTFTLNYSNAGPGVAENVVITDPIPAGTTFASASAPGTFAAGIVTWNLGNLKAGAAGSVTMTVNVPANGTYSNTGTLTYNVSLTSKSITSNTTSTVKTSGADAGTDTGSDTGSDTGVTDSGSDSGSTDTGGDSGSTDTGGDTGAGACAVDSDCDTATQFCNTATKTCVSRVPSGDPMPTVAGHTPALDGKCATAAAAAVCASTVCDTADDKCGYADGHTCGADPECRSADCAAVSKICVPAGGCKVDGDCDPGDYCNTPTSMCTPKLENGEPIPSVTGHTPAVDGKCATDVAPVVCKSGVCDPKDDKCGLADGDGPCTTNEECRSDVCGTDGVCGSAPDAGPDAGDDDTGVTDSGAGLDGAVVDGATDDGGMTPADDDGTIEGGGFSCEIPARRGGAPAVLVGLAGALALVGVRRRRR